jgi:hypothetical protein
VRTVPGLCEVYPGICPTPEGKERKTSVRVAGMKTEYAQQSVHKINA